MVSKEDAFLKKLLATFAVEADEHLKAITAGLLELEKTPAAPVRQEIIQTVFREAHSLKGAARAVNRADVVAVCQQLENVFSAMNTGNRAVTQVLLDALHRVVTGLEKLLASPEDKDGGQADAIVELLASLLDDRSGAAERAGSGGHTPGSPSLSQQERTPRPRVPKTRAITSDTVRISVAKLVSLFQHGEELIAAKLAAEQRIADLNSLSATIRERKGNHEKLYTQLRTLAPTGDASAHAANLPHILELMEEEKSSSQQIERSLRTLLATAETDSRALTKMVDNLLEEAKKILMLPLTALFEILPKLVRDLAAEQGKRVAIDIQDNGIEIDRRIQEQLKAPLIHIIRNCIDHGIEMPDERLRKNKAGEGRISISASQIDTGKVEILISDDGAGINRDKLLSAAKKAGSRLTREGNTPDDSDIASLVFQPGVSTSAAVTDLSGRGLGLAIVREKIEKLHGTISIRSGEGAGTTFRIVLPLMLSSFRAVIVRAAGQVFALPTINVDSVARLDRKDIKTVENQETVQMNGVTLPLVPLTAVLGIKHREAGNAQGNFQQIVVLASGEQRIAFGVDEILYEQEVLLKDLGSQFRRVRNIAGSTTLGSGLLVPFLNVADMITGCMQGDYTTTASPVGPAAAAIRKSILVVEDSITARTLFQNILGAAGYKVESAVDGIDALTKLKTGTFNLVLSDVEMARMDGFTLTATIRSDKKYSELPIILITALDSRENRERGIEAGANAYIVKSSFDEASLLEVINRLI